MNLCFRLGGVGHAALERAPILQKKARDFGYTGYRLSIMTGIESKDVPPYKTVTAKVSTVRVPITFVLKRGHDMVNDSILS